MTTLTDVPEYTPNEIYEIQGTDPVQGAAAGASFSGIGIDNQPHQQLANRTAWLYGQVESIWSAIYPYNYVGKAGNYTAATTDNGNIIQMNGANTTCTLPLASAMSNQWIGVFANALGVQVASGSDFQGSVYSQYTSYNVVMNEGDLIFFSSNGTSWQLGGGNGQSLNTLTYPITAPPPSDVNLQPGNRIQITHTNVTAVPWRCATNPGLYRVTAVLTSASTRNCACGILPNNNNYPGAFFCASAASQDQACTGFGSSGGPESFTSITNYPYLSGIHGHIFNTYDRCYHYPFYGPSSHDSNWGGCPIIIEYLISTYTAAKIIKCHSVCQGGIAHSTACWQDTTTPWLSLGTFHFPLALTATFSGTTLIERLF